MFDRFSQLKKLKALQDELKKEKITVEKEGIKITMNGKMEIEELSLNPSLAKEKQESLLKDCLNEAIRGLRYKVAQKMGSMREIAGI